MFGCRCGTSSYIFYSSSICWIIQTFFSGCISYLYFDMAGLPLVVIPKSLRFLAPIDWAQKRQIALLNLSDHNVIYVIYINDDLDCTIVPSSGTLKAFTTTEFHITLAPDVKALNDCSLLVRSIPNKFVDKEDARWNCTVVPITLIPHIAPPVKIRLPSKGIVNFNPEQLRPTCDRCATCPRCAKYALKRATQINQAKLKESGFRSYLYILKIFAVIVGAYFVYVMVRYCFMSDMDSMILSVHQSDNKLCKSKST